MCTFSLLSFCLLVFFSFFFFFNDTATTEIYTLSLHDALPICLPHAGGKGTDVELVVVRGLDGADKLYVRSEEHTSELQSRRDLVCRLLLEKKKKKKNKKKRKEKKKKKGKKKTTKHDKDVERDI